MKVVVCFDDVRVTVPCGDGSIPVRELISKAVHRYKRALGKSSNHWVEVSNLKTISGGGILDPDDQLNDVVDDKEQLIAEFEEQDRPSIQHNGGDGASASSTGTTSPDIFQTGTSSALPLHDLTNTSVILDFLQPCQNSTSSNSMPVDVVVTPMDLALGSSLRVRRGSEPSLSQLVSTSVDKIQVAENGLQPFIPRRESIRESDDPRSDSSDDEKKLKITVHGSLDRKKLGHGRFARDALRTSLSNRPEMYNWLEAQENAALRNMQAKAKERTGPIEGHDGEDVPKTGQTWTDSYLVCLYNDGGPLGIHAVPACDESGKDMGLHIQSIEQDRPVHKDGRIKPNDIIVEINGNSLHGVPFLRAQDIFRAAMDTKEICLKIIKRDSIDLSSIQQHKGKHNLPPQPPPTLPKPRSHAPIKPSPLTLPSPEPNEHIAIPVPAPRDTSKKTGSISESINGTERASGGDTIHSVSKIKAESLFSSKNTSPNAIVIKPGPPIRAPKRGQPPALPARNPSTSLTARMPDASLNAVTNTRRIGKKLIVQLKKGPLGLGFSITSRDNQTDGNCPIYIRNILPKGAAVQSSQLRPGDRLLQVNGVEMTGKSQAEAVAFLRTIPEGSIVELIISRQEEVDEKFKVPRKLGDATLPENEGGFEGDGGIGQPAISPLQPSHCGNEMDVTSPGTINETLTLHIPLNETGSAGLGVSVKGNTEASESGIRDLGIFVKTVLQGGAAYKDGRLQVNDKLLEVNGINLEGLSNTSAMEALRVAMMEDGQIPGVITLTVSRKAGPKSFSLSSGDSPSNSQIDIVPPVVHQRSSSASDVGVIIHQRSSSASEVVTPSHHRFGSDQDMPSPIPPARNTRVAVLRERFTDSGNGLRNESYNKATHESFNDSCTFTNIMPSVSNTNKSQLELQSQNEANFRIVEKDTYSLPIKTQRPHSTIGFMHGQLNSQSSVSDDEAFLNASVGFSKENSDRSPQGDIILPFTREGFGRQSMSEKRKGHLDPRSTETYKQVKANKENKGGNDVLIPKGPMKAPRQPEDMSPQAQSAAPAASSMMHVTNDSSYQPNHVPLETLTTNIKRASSLENLVNIPSGTSTGGSSGKSEGNYDSSSVWRPTRFGRARACNDSFRAAVDRSYDALDPALMDTLEEESAESGAFTFEPSHSSHSSVSSDATNEDTNSLKRRKAKEKKGLFKGFLRLGKGRKSDDEAMRRSRSEERPQEHIVDHRADYLSEQTSKDGWAVQPYSDSQNRGFIALSDHNQQQKGRKTSQQEQERFDEEYARLRDQHVAVQRLRSQSVDPTLGRSAGILSSSSEGTSPFQVYSGSSTQRQHHPAPQQSLIARPDPRTLHPAAISHGLLITEPNYSVKNQSQSSSGALPDPKVTITKAVMSRAEYIQQLRSSYQQRHRQRHGVYPLDDQEEQYEMQLREKENKQWDSRSPEYENPVKDVNMLQFYDRSPSRQSEQKLPEDYGIFLNTNNSTQFYCVSHQPNYQQFDTANQSRPGSRPQSRGAPGSCDTFSYHQQPHNIHSNQYHQHRQHHQPQQRHEEVTSPHFQDPYISGGGVAVNYRAFESRPQHFYNVPPQAYRSTPNHYNHHRGNASYVDSSSTKV